MKKHPKVKKRTIGTGMYVFANRVSVVARIGSGKGAPYKEARFPLVDDDGIPYSKSNNRELEKARIAMIEELIRERASNGTATGSLGATIDQFLIDHPLIKLPDGTKRHQDYHSCLPPWRQSPLAAIQVTELTRKPIREQLKAWADEGYAASTLNHRKRLLGHVLREVLGADEDEDVIVPTATIKKAKEADPEARGIPIPILLFILAQLPDRGRGIKGESRSTVSLTKIRLRVMVWTGLAHVSLKRLPKRHVLFHERRALLPARKKGRGAKEVWVDLVPGAFDALQEYDREHLWQQRFSNSSMRTTWRRAIKNARTKLDAHAKRTGDTAMLEQFNFYVKPNSHPYDGRHSYLSELYRLDGDIRAVAEAGQISVETAMRYTKAAVPERIAKMFEKMSAQWFPDAPKPERGVVRNFQVVK